MRLNSDAPHVSWGSATSAEQSRAKQAGIQPKQTARMQARAGARTQSGRRMACMQAFGARKTYGWHRPSSTN